MNKNNLLFLMSYTKKHLFFIVISLLFSIIYSLSTLAIPYLVGEAIDFMIDINQVNFEVILNNCFLILILSILILLSQYFSSLINNKITFAISHDIRKDFNNKIHRLPLKYLDNMSVGDLVNRNINDVEIITDGLIMGFNQFFTSLITIVSSLIIMFILNYQIALVVFILTPLSLFVARFISNSTYKLFKKQATIRSKQTSLINEMITNQKVVQQFNMEKENFATFDEINKQLEKTSTNAVFFSSLVNPVTRFINSIIYSSVALFGALVCINSTTLKVGVLVAFLSYVNQYTKPFNEITGVVSELQNAFSSSSRVREILEEQEEEQSYIDTLEIAKGDIEIKDVYFSYTKDRKLIENLNLNIKKGTKVAIVGPTGCGKTTLINLLMRFYDVDSGDIKVDSKSIYKLSRKSLRNNYGMVLQDTWLKETSIFENVRMGKENASKEEVINALKESHAYKFVEQLPNGINTIIKEDSGISHGQKQLLCISRIMLTKPPLLILDEATSSIDTRTEIEIQNAFNKLMKGKTSFIVAHRLSTIKNADLILVMKNGNIIEKGNHQELIEQKGFYFELYNSQFCK